MAGKKSPDMWKNVPSPFCGIGTDDLGIQVKGDTVTVVENGCAVNTPAFEQPLGDTKVLVNGKPASLEKAVGQAANILNDANLPLIGGVATDVNGVRATLSLADLCRAVVDNMNSTAAMRNILAVQSSGFMNTTLAEVKNRADLLVVVGCDLEPLFPRFFERYIWNKESMFIDDTTKREVVFLGQAPTGTATTSPCDRDPQVLACNKEDLPEVLAVLRALIQKKPITAERVGGIETTSIKVLAEKLLNAKYGVIAWAAGALDFSNAELTVQMMSDMIKEINQTTRCAGLPLGGKEGDQTANQVCGWITGYPVRTSYARGFPQYDPFLNSTDHLLNSGEADALLWISAFNNARTPPITDIPTIVVGRSGMSFDKQPDIYIPVGTPGIDHSGHAYRTDNVVALRLQKIRDTKLPSTAEVLNAIEQALLGI